MIFITAAVEGLVDEAAAQKLAEVSGYQIDRVYVTNGKGSLDKRLRGFNNAARFAPWLILRDLDADASCPAELRGMLLAEPAVQMCFRVAVPQVESWILADGERFARSFRVRSDTIPSAPDTLSNAKRALLALVQGSTDRALKSDMIPRSASGAREGPAYSSRLIEFIRSDWRPIVAAEWSPSLARCLRALDKLRAQNS